MYKKGQLALAGLLSVIALIVGLIFALPVIIPDSTQTALENYELAKVDKQIKTERLANLRDYPSLSVIGKDTIVDSDRCNITTTLKNVGASKCLNPTVKHIIARDAEPGVTEGTQIGPPIFGGVSKTQLKPGVTRNFNITFGSANIPLCELLDNDSIYGQPNHQLKLEITTQCFTTTWHQFQETETVIVTPDRPPRANAGPDQAQNLSANQQIQFDGSGSFDPDGSIVSFSWDFADPTNTTKGTGATPTHGYPVAAALINVTLTVTDNIGLIDRDSMTVTAIVTT